MKPAPKSALVIISWDGRSPPLALLTIDAAPDFDLMLFDYSGTATTAPVPLLSHATECKGQIFAHVAAVLDRINQGHAYIAIIDDDVEISSKAINHCLSIAVANGLSSCAPALTHDSFHSHKSTLQQSGSHVRTVPFVEVMMPIYAMPLFQAAAAFFGDSISSYGIDQFVFPMLQQVSGAGPAAIIDSTSARHTRAISSNNRVFSNGRTAAQERVHMRQRCIAWLRAHYPEQVGTPWFYAIFSPWDGPARFWVDRLKPRQTRVSKS